MKLPVWLCALLGHAVPRPIHPTPGMVLTPRCPRCGQRVTVRT